MTFPRARANGRWRAVLVLAATLPATQAQAGEVAKTTPAAFVVGMPAGFEDIARSQEAMVDVIFGGRKIGQAMVEYEPGKLTFRDVDALLDLMPDLLDRAGVRTALAAGKLDTHGEAACNAPAKAGTCPRLDPQVAAIAFDQDRFRLQLFVNPRLLKVRSASEETYLPRPETGLSLVDAVAGTIAGGSRSDTIFAVQNRAMLGIDDARLISVSSYASGTGLVGDVLAAQIDKPGLRYTAGMYWAPDIDLLGRRKIVGAGIETQFDTRLDKDVIRGTPLIVSLSQRSRVDILVNGKLVSSQSYEAGNQGLDTSALPDGAYEVTLRIQEVSGTNREERRFYSKNARIAPMGKTYWFLHGGVLANEEDASFLSATRTTYFEGGVARRLNPHVAIDGTVVVTGGKAIAEIGGYVILPFAQVRLGVVGSTRGDKGVLFQVNSTGASTLNYNVDLRRVQSHDGLPIVPTGRQGRVESADAMAGFNDIDYATGTFTQAIADVSYRLPHAQIGLSGFYRRDGRGQTNYAVGPTLRWSFLHRTGIDMTLEANVSQSNRGRSGFVGVRLQLLRPHAVLTSTVGAQSTASAGEPNRSSVVGGIGGSWQREDVLGSNLTVSGSLDHTPENDLAHGRADMRGAFGALAVDAVQPLNGGGGQYSLGLQTRAIVSPTMLAIGGREQGDSVIAVQVKNVPATSKFEVLVNETPRGTVRGGDTLPVSVIPYRQYRVRVRPLQGEIVHLDDSDRTVSVYPGNVAKLAWTARRVVAMFGRAVWPDGSPVADADIATGDAIGHTDLGGYFQIETDPAARLELRAPGGKICRITINGGKPLEGYVALGTLTCADDRPFGSFRITAAN